MENRINQRITISKRQVDISLQHVRARKSLHPIACATLLGSSSFPLYLHLLFPSLSFYQLPLLRACQPTTTLPSSILPLDYITLFLRFFHFS